MKINGAFILGAAMIAVAILTETFWFNTGATALGILSLLAALTASGALARYIRLDDASSDIRLRKFLTVTGLET